MIIRLIFWHNLVCMNLPRNVAAPYERGRSRPHLHRALCLLLLMFSWHSNARSQEAAVVTFTLDFPGSEPSHYAISVSSDGHSTYDSDGKLSPDSEGDPFHLDFSLSSETSRRVRTTTMGPRIAAEQTSTCTVLPNCTRIRSTAAETCS